MSTVNELRTQRAKSWEKANAFLIAHRDGKGILSAVDTATYEAMEQEIVNLGREIERQERLDAMEREMAVPVSTPLTSKPEAAKPADTKVGRASDAYKKAFWNVTRHKDHITPEMRNALQEGTDSEGGYLVPDEFEKSLVTGLSLTDGSLRIVLSTPPLSVPMRMSSPPQAGCTRFPLWQPTAPLPGLTRRGPIRKAMKPSDRFSWTHIRSALLSRCPRNS